MRNGEIPRRHESGNLKQLTCERKSRQMQRNLGMQFWQAQHQTFHIPQALLLGYSIIQRNIVFGTI